MKNITVDELKARMDNGETLNIIDVREPHEYAEYNIGAKLYPLGRIQNMDIEDLENLKNQELILHCKMGGRSMQACMILEQAGFTDVATVTGGMVAWKQNFG